MRHEFVSNKKSNRLLQELAEFCGRNRSRVVRDAIALYADQEAVLDKIESDPKFIAMMEKSAADIRAGRASEQAEVEPRFTKKRKRK